MKKLIKFIVSSLVDQPERIKITYQENPQTHLSFYTLSVAPEDIGKVIGKKGKIIKAIRNLLNLKAAQSQQKIVFNLQEE